MPQLVLPIFPDALTPIKELLYVGKQDGKAVYFQGVLPVFSHGEEDWATFRIINLKVASATHESPLPTRGGGVGGEGNGHDR